MKTSYPQHDVILSPTVIKVCLFVCLLFLRYTVFHTDLRPFELQKNYVFKLFQMKIRPFLEENVYL